MGFGLGSFGSGLRVFGFRAEGLVHIFGVVVRALVLGLLELGVLC